MSSPPSLKLFLGKGGEDLTYLHLEEIDMSRFGPKKARRVSDVEFNEDSQNWEARLRDGTLIAEGESRNEVLGVERETIDSMLETGQGIP